MATLRTRRDRRRVEILRLRKVNYWTGGQGSGFELEFAEFSGIDHAVFSADGTVAFDSLFRH